MKKMKFTICTLFAALTFLVLPSCDDGDDDGGSKSDFVGLWESEEGGFFEQFDADGTGLSYGRSFGREPFAWRVSKGSLDIDYDMGDWTDIEHHKYRFSNGGKTLDLKYYAYTIDGEYVEEDADDTEWKTYHKVGTNDDDDDDSSATEPSGSVSITNISAQKKTSTGLQINVTVSASGVSAGDVKGLGAVGGTTSDGSGVLYASLGGGKLSGTVKIVSGLKSKTRYYVKAYLTTKSGTVYSAVKSVTTP